MSIASCSTVTDGGCCSAFDIIVACNCAPSKTHGVTGNKGVSILLTECDVCCMGMVGILSTCGVRCVHCGIMYEQQRFY